METPSAELVDAYLTEIAKAYNVKYVSEFSTSEAKSEDDEDTSDGGEKVSVCSRLGFPLLRPSGLSFRALLDP